MLWRGLCTRAMASQNTLDLRMILQILNFFDLSVCILCVLLDSRCGIRTQRRCSSIIGRKRFLCFVGRRLLTLVPWGMGVSREQKIVIQHALALLYTLWITEMFWHRFTCQSLVYVFHGCFFVVSAPSSLSASCLAKRFFMESEDQ